MKPNRRSLAIVLLMVLVVASCGKKDTWALLWKQTGILADSFIQTYAPSWPHRDQLSDAWHKTQELIDDWRPGTPCQNILQAMDAAITLLTQVPVVGQQQVNFMAVIAASVHSMVTHFVTECAPTTRVIPPKFSPEVEQAAEKLSPPKTKDDLDSEWKTAGGPIKEK